MKRLSLENRIMLLTFLIIILCLSISVAFVIKNKRGIKNGFERRGIKTT